MRIAIVGSGISGLSAFWLLNQQHDVLLFEKDDRPGGHSNTVEVDTSQGNIPVDTGFIVYNVNNYPNLIQLFNYLKVETEATDMSFSVSRDNGEFEYLFSYKPLRLNYDLDQFFLKKDDLHQYQLVIKCYFWKFST